LWSRLQWFPDSSRLLFGGRHPTHFLDIFTVSIDGGTIVELGVGFYPILLSDGTKIVCISSKLPDSEEPTDWGLYVLNSDGSEKFNIIVDLNSTDIGNIVAFPYGSAGIPWFFGRY